MTLMECLQSGAEFHFEPLTGGCMLMKDGKEVTDVKFTTHDFINLRDNGTVVKTGEMGQGHARFRGKVIFYRHQFIAALLGRFA